MSKAAPAWLVPIAAIFFLQTVSSFLSRLIPIIAPIVSMEFGWDGSVIGYLTSSNSLGSLALLLGGSALLKQLGGMRVLQFCLFAGSACLTLFLHPSVGVALLACFIMGLSTGAANPAGSDVLQRFAPPSKRNLIFSIKQAGVPVGGVMAGLFIPTLVAWAGWRPTLFICALLVVVVTALTWRVATQADERVSTGRPLLSLPTLSSLRTLQVPLQALTHNRGLFKMSIVGGLFAISQACWFTFMVIYLIDGLGYSLGHAGVMFAVMQGGGVIGRIALGWLSDYLKSATQSLVAAASLSAATTILLGVSTPAWPLWSVVLLAFAAGCSAASWNGVLIAEIARRSAPGQIAETAAGSSIVIALTNMVVPTAFAAFVAVTQRYDYAFYLAGLFTLLVLVVLPRDKA